MPQAPNIDSDALDIDRLLPAVVIGRCGPVNERALAQRSGALPGWIAWWQHQYGGYLCLQAGMTGLLLPLAAQTKNHPRMKLVVDGLEALGDDSEYGVVWRHFRELSPLHLTTGNPYEISGIRTLESFIGQGATFPQITGAEEALVRFQSHQLLFHFEGWRMASLVGNERIAGERSLDAATLDELAGWLVPAPPGEPGLQAFLLWNNSD